MHSAVRSVAGKLSRVSVVLCLAVVCLSLTEVANSQEAPGFESHVVLVQFEPGVVIAEGAAKSGVVAFDEAANEFGVTTIERAFPFLDHVQPTPVTARNLGALRRTYYVRFSVMADPKRVARVMSAVGGVAYAEPVLINRLQVAETKLEPNDVLFGVQTYLRHLRLSEAWNFVKGEDGNPRVVIAIVDGGGDWRHEDLRANVWINKHEFPDNGIDDDLNGFIDDVHGINLANDDAFDNDPTGLPQAPLSAWHGTAVAGAASAVADNSIGIAGAAWNAELMHINAGCYSSDLNICYGYEGLLYAAANGADIINVSWSGSPVDEVFNVLTQALDLATDLGALIVASAGNQGDNVSIELLRRYPAVHPRVLSVGATAKDTRARASFSNYGKRVNVFAPGIGIATTAPDNEYSLAANGTSFATPLVSGLAALVLTRLPHLSPDAIREQIRLTSENIDAENPGNAGQMGRGFVNAEAAVQAPNSPGVRIKRWSWRDTDGDGEISAAEDVTIQATLVNHLQDAQQLVVGLGAAESYPFIEFTTENAIVGSLESGDSTFVTFKFSVASDAPTNSTVRFNVQIRDGAFDDEPDQLSLSINRSLDQVHAALSALFLSTNGFSWHNNSGWSISRTPTLSQLAQWNGVQVSQDWLVGLTLRNNNLIGTLPAELGDLSNLLGLNLSDNSISGGIPRELGDLLLLRELWLDHNGLSGAIPVELGGLPRLQVLLLQNNSLSGPIPDALGNLSELAILALSSNSLSGEIPKALGELSKLEWLVLHINSLTGAIPIEIANLSKLEWLSLSSNNLSGAIPPELATLSRLERLLLNNNNLSGTIPSELGNLSRLLELYLNNNALSGEIPTELGSLSRLEEFSLNGNALSGRIPNELGNLSRLKFLNLQYNALSGMVPDELGNLSQLRRLDISNNALVGTLPRTLLQLTNLEGLYFDGQDVCAPQDDEFQAWLSSIPNTSGSICAALTLAGEVPDQAFTVGAAIADLVLPEAEGGVPPYTYVLEPALPLGLSFSDTTRTIRGVPMGMAAANEYTYSVADNAGSGTSLVFTIEVAGAVTFADSVANHSYPRAQPILPLVLPDAVGGVSPIEYILSPMLPAGLALDTTTRTISGIPVTVTGGPVRYAYKAADINGSADSLRFSIEVFSPVSIEQTLLPAEFAVRGNYPNPFQRSTHIVIDLPWPARVTIEVLDATGRLVFVESEVELTAGWEQSVELSGATLSSGLYLYRVHASSPIGDETHFGRFVRIR